MTGYNRADRTPAPSKAVMVPLRDIRADESINPRGTTSDSISVTKPYLYSRFAKASIVLISFTYGCLPQPGPKHDKRVRFLLKKIADQLASVIGVFLPICTIFTSISPWRRVEIGILSKTLGTKSEMLTHTGRRPQAP